MVHRLQKTYIAFVLAVSMFGIASAGGDWPNFRGPNHDGISQEKGLKIAWTEPLPLVWEKTVGSSFSSFACVGDKVYTCGTKEKQQTILCLGADTGKVIWEKPIEEEFRDSMGGDGPRATPTVDDGRVYILGARGTLLCLGADTGDEIWKTQLTVIPKWGYAGSILIEKGMAIAASGGSDGALVAFDKKSGKVIWRCGDDITGYATPYPFTFAGTRYVAVLTGESAIIAEATTGRLAWRTPWKTAYKVNAASPIYNDGHLFLGSGYDTGCALFSLHTVDGTLAIEEVWKSKVFLSKFQTPLLHEGKLYGSDQKALVCVDFLTGKELWRKRRIKHGTLVLADGHLLLLTESGRLQIAKVSPVDFTPLASADILADRCWTVPVLHRGKLYARDMVRLVCFDLR